MIVEALVGDLLDTYFLSLSLYDYRVGGSFNFNVKFGAFFHIDFNIDAGRKCNIFSSMSFVLILRKWLCD